MKKICYKFKIKDAYSSWIETISDRVDETISIEDHANQLVQRFNNSLKPGETSRSIIFIRTKLKNEKDIHINHVWEKKSLITEKGGYDRYKCKNCGVTGKRYGLNSTVIVDAKYYKKHFYCQI